MAHDGFDIQVLIPNNSPFYYDVDAELGANVSRAYNQAISRVLKKHPNKFIGIAAAPLQDISGGSLKPSSPSKSSACTR